MYYPASVVKEKDEEIKILKEEIEHLKSQIPDPLVNDFRISELPPLVMDHEVLKAHDLLQDLNNLVYHLLRMPGHSKEETEKRHQMIEAFAFRLTGKELARYT